MPDSSSGDIVEATHAVLVTGSRDIADRYQKASARLKEQLGQAQFREFSACCLKIAGSGWKSSESVDEYLNVAALTIDAKELIHIGAVGLELSGYSSEPSASYFRAVVYLFNHELSEDLPLIESTGLQIQQKYNHASGLVSDFFRAAVHASSHLDRADFLGWLAIVPKFLPLPREHLVNLLSQVDRITGISWQFVQQLLEHSLDAVVAYLQRYPELAEMQSARVCDEVDLLVLRFAAEGVDQLLAGIAGWQGIDDDEALTLLDLGVTVTDVVVLDSLFRHRQKLPLADPEILRQWLSIGLDETRGNQTAALAWVSVESSRSNEVLEKLEGQVRFTDYRRTFDLIAEAMTGRRMLISSDEGEAQLRQADEISLLSTDGRNLSLPAAVNLFDHEEDNFGFYKVSLFHQLGYGEFGCFNAIKHVARAIDDHDDSRLAERIFLLAEDARIDWQLAHYFPGARGQISRQKAKAWSLRSKQPVTRRGQLLEVMVASGLDADWESTAGRNLSDGARVHSLMATLQKPAASVADSIEVMAACYQLITNPAAGQSALSSGEAAEDLVSMIEELPEPIAFRGELDVATVESTLKLEALVEDLLEELQSEPDQDTLSMGAADPDQIDLEELKQGEVSDGVGIMMTELAHELDVDVSELAGASREEALEFVGGIAAGIKDSTKHIYDEWDHAIGDYRARWCTLFEHHTLERDEDYVRRAMVEHEDLSRRIRQHLNKVRPEMLRKVRGVPEGEELDLEHTVAYIVDKRAGFTPEEKIYVQRQRRERDVSTLFLLDMSASTDDIIPDPDAEPIPDPEIDDDEYLVDYFRQRKEYESNARRIIDLEKESVILMAEALEKLGDAYSVCGFSGYGRDQVDYYLCKDFDDPLDARTRGQIGGIKPCRSTRMGAPIRHAIKRLLQTGSRIKALIIISDGYPQDHDYGTDRNSREYGLMDTMKALSEAKQQGVLTYCLTVDPSGHDYLREMCPDSQYMIIQDIDQLPEELSRVYRSLTG